MKPIMLKMQAFGPYNGTEVIDFSSLSAEGTFLIKGPTGSGKTTIFDAMTFALYGGCSGEDSKTKTGRNDFEAWRCIQSQDSLPTIIEFEFSVHDCTYRFRRTMELKRTNWSETHAAEIMNENGIFQPVYEKVKDVNAYAEQVLGLNKEQFRQVVLLPQGQFEKFLVASSDEKEVILTKIFGTNKWKKYADKFYEKASAEKEKIAGLKKEIDTDLEKEGKDLHSVEDLRNYIDKSKAELDKLTEEFLKFNVSERQEKLKGDIALYEQFAALHTAEKKLEFLNSESERERINLTRQERDEAVKAEPFRSPIEKLSELSETKKSRDKALSEALEKLPIFEEAAANANKALERYKKESKVTELNQRLGEYKTKKETYERLDSLREQCEVAQSNLNKARKAEEKAEEKFEEHKKITAELFAKADKEGNLYTEYKRRYFEGMYGEIANDLSDGEACPVCGSLEHPRLASKSKDSVSQAQLELQEKKAQKADNEWKTANKETQDFSEKLKALLEASKEKSKAFTEAETKFNAAKTNLVEGINSLTELDEAIADIDKKISDDKSKLEHLLKEKSTAEQNRASHKAVISEAEKEAKKAEKELTDAFTKLENDLYSNGYADIEEVESKLRDDDIRSNLIKILQAYESDVKGEEKRINELTDKLRGCKEPDNNQFNTRQDEITNVNNDYQRQSRSLTDTIERLEKLFKRLSENAKIYDEKHAQVDDDFNFAKKLRGDTGIGLQRYVLGVMFDQVIVQANAMLRNVHGGRYTLFRSDERGAGNKRGLELKAHDNRSPEKEGRLVSMLSGGEKFLVSLALSIGMSTVAQQSGVQIDALFIDEGFGTLDDTSIADAIRILQNVKHSSGVIGIISHVKLLETVINSTIEVKKTDMGSTIVM